jgi:hypothetical protein
MNLDNMTKDECLAIDKKKVMENSVIINNILLENPVETINIDILGQTFTVDKKKVMENSVIINNILLENPVETDVQLPAINENEWSSVFKYFIKFLDYKYHEIPKPLPERGVCFIEDNCGSEENVEFINNFYDKTIVDKKNQPTELIKSICLANYLGATKFLEWCCAKYASVLVEQGLVKVD